MTALHPTALKFIELAMATDPSEHVKAELILDTNVGCELYSIRDVLEEVQQRGLVAALDAAGFRYRAHRLRHTLVLAWWLNRHAVSSSLLGTEHITIVVGRLAPEPDRPRYDELSFRMTKSFVHVIRDLVLGKWPLGTLVEVDHHKLQHAADDEILRVATKDHTPVITWEGYQSDGTLSANPGKLRNRCIAAGVPVYTPQEYLQQHGVDVDAEAIAFIKACDNASWVAQWENVLEGRRDVDLLIGFYRLALFGQVSREIAAHYLLK